MANVVFTGRHPCLFDYRSPIDCGQDLPAIHHGIPKAVRELNLDEEAYPNGYRSTDKFSRNAKSDTRKHGVALVQNLSRLGDQVCESLGFLSSNRLPLLYLVNGFW